MNKQNFTVGLGLGKLFDWVVYEHRKRMYKSLKLDSSQMESMLDIGSTSDVGKSSNAFLYFFKVKQITSVSDQIITNQTRSKFSNVNFVQGDGLSLNYPDSSFDFVFSNAVLEHVGNLQNVEKFISEAARVAKNKIILITPNRWFPLETHSKLLFIHWLPSNLFRLILRKLGMEFLSREENLNLLSKSQIKTIVEKFNLESCRVTYIKFLGYPSNIVIEIVK